MPASDIYIPQSIINYNVYNDNDGSKFIGIADELVLPDIQLKTVSVDEAGTAGEFDLPIPSQAQSMTFTINSHTISKSYWYAILDGGRIAITARAAELNINANDASIQNLGYVVNLRGLVKQITSGSIKKSDVMGSALVAEAIYYKVEYDGETMCEIDKLNNVFQLGGTDLTDDITKLI